MPLRSLRSAPAQNACSPAPVITTQRTSPGSAARRVHRSSSSSPMRVLNALRTSGRFRVTSSTCGLGCLAQESAIGVRGHGGLQTNACRVRLHTAGAFGEGIVRSPRGADKPSRERARGRDRYQLLAADRARAARTREAQGRNRVLPLSCISRSRRSFSGSPALRSGIGRVALIPPGGKPAHRVLNESFQRASRCSNCGQRNDRARESRSSCRWRIRASRSAWFWACAR